MSPACLVPALLLALGAGAACAQSSCSSDGQPRPLALLERFTSADCGGCWRDARAPAAGRRELAIDWVLPGAKGADAPLATVATRDGLARLQALNRPAPAKADALSTPLTAAARTLRVAHGLPVNDYLGTSIELKPAGKGPWTAWLLLVETLPAGTEGSPVERNVVRNAFQPAWRLRGQLSKAEQLRLLASRPMQIPQDAQPGRLRVVGWVEDALGRVRAIAESRCGVAGTR